MTSPPAVGPNWPGSNLYVTDTRAPQLNLSAAVGQMNYTFRFELVNGVTGEHLGDITPIRDATLTHNTGQTIKRRLTFHLGKDDTAYVNALTDRINLFQTIPFAPNPDRPDGDWPLGRYMWSDNPRRLSTGGRLASPVLQDEMALVDLEVTKAVGGSGTSIVLVLADVLEGLPIAFDAEQSPFLSAQSWGMGTLRGQILEALATAGDYWSPWFDNNGIMRFVRTFDPARKVVDLDLDDGYRVFRQDIIETDELLIAPNRFVVVSNSAGDQTSPVFGVADVPVTAPNSIANIGFVRQKTVDLQVFDAGQAAAIAQSLAVRAAIFEQVALSTPADPRHDGYNVIRWQGHQWVELGWSMTLVPGQPMTHSLRRSYGAAE